MGAVNDRELMYFNTPEEWEQWLAANHTHDGVRVAMRKKGSTKPGITYAEALDVALCWGWIDGTAGRIDDDYYSNGFSPRRSRSPWSQVNQGHVARLIEAGRMKPEGLAEIERAKADGRWEAAYRVKDAPTPPDLQAALDASPAASAFFATLNKQQRFAFLFRLNNVKLEKTRAAKIATYIEMLERGEKLN